MRRFLIVLGVLAILGLMLGSAQAALTNEVVNGDFATGDTSGWVNPIPGHGSFWIIAGPPFYAGIIGNVADESGISQITDDKTGGGWDPNGTAKNWWFSFDAAVNHAWGEAYLFYYGLAGNPTPLGNPDSPGAGWVELIDGETTGLVTVSNHYSFSGTIQNYQPEWFAVAFEGQIMPTFGLIGFTNVDLKGQCLVPVPPAVWLFGSGLLGLVGWRRFKA